MVEYNPKDWFGLIFKFHKSDTFRKLFWVIASVAVYSWIVIYIELEIFEMRFSSTVMHTLLGFVLSLLLVFRTNTAYDRWWEGRKLWGALVNVSRNLTMKMLTYVEKGPEQKTMIDLISLYPSVLKEHLRDGDYTELTEKQQALLQSIHPKYDHKPNAIARKMHGELKSMVTRTRLDAATQHTMILDVNAFTDICGGCERIKKTPIPYNYNIFIKKFIFVYIITMPIGMAASFQYWTILITAFTFYTLASLELIAETIEDPFGLDANDLPTDDIASTIAKNIRELANE